MVIVHSYVKCQRVGDVGDVGSALLFKSVNIAIVGSIGQKYPMMDIWVLYCSNIAIFNYLL